ncbi:bucentaur or craniofacial development-domain-containing protein [Dichomitus squalens]|nr:bucentaur or craniofacial development-domain-containing protein [Dichomitus squalens]
MPTVDTDSDNDPDYVPPDGNGDEHGSDVDAPAPKRARTDTAPEATSSVDTANEKTGAEVYAAFKASLNAPSSQIAQASASREVVKIVKRYRFAGEETTEVVEVPADSEEARKWPLWIPSDDAHGSSTPGPSKDDTTTESAAAIASSSPAASASTSAKTLGKRPGPRKAKGKLADVPAKKEPVKKLTTLDKSAMDWRAHVQGGASAEMKDELEANRRGGGFLEKVEFLQRVEARKEEVLDANKGKRRR